MSSEEASGPAGTAEIDARIMELIRMRRDAALREGSLRTDAGLPAVDPSAEKAALERYSRMASDNGTDPDTAESVCRALVKESAELLSRMPRRGSSLRICIVGGGGRMGAWFAHLLGASGHRLDIVDPGSDNGLGIRDAALADVVIISTPIHAVEGVLSELDGICGPDTLIMDVSSLKSPFCDTIREMASRREVCSLHPMFGPSAASMYGRNLIICDCGCPRASEAALELFGGYGAHIRRMPVEDHDAYMSYVLGLSHALNIAFFTVLERSGISFEDMMSVASTTFNKNLEANRSVALEDPMLYYEIQRLNSNSQGMWGMFSGAVEDLRRASLSEDPSEFADLMSRGRRYFSPGNSDDGR
jgi:chorismate mutase/prephenate dehydrogenase